VGEKPFRAEVPYANLTAPTSATFSLTELSAWSDILRRCWVPTESRDSLDDGMFRRERQSRLIVVRTER
jgi:hypothetical protein